jgi:hypothetical protein
MPTKPEIFQSSEQYYSRFHVHAECSKLSVGYRGAEHASLNDYLTHYPVLYCTVLSLGKVLFELRTVAIDWEALTAPVAKFSLTLPCGTREHRRNAEHMDVPGVRDQCQKS